ncbi:MAG: hypothetical protein HC838_04635 [Spirulinaceae cyanobacterium RM2_2_10]|nr:hypothetical protein [Spirulinaceae cyanobacterium SM2_1_0]NJO19480.1 hypothetical protein [Spirulinaceae cyanobacterium RM2_2_10]
MKVNTPAMLAPTPRPAPFIELFLASVDHLSDVWGLSVPAIVQLDELRQLPVGSLGRSLVEFLQQHHLQPLDTGLRRKQLHDSLHVLTGYGTDPLGEAEVQAFLLGVKFNPANFLLGLSLLAALHRQRRRGQFSQSPAVVWQRLRTAYGRGVRADFDPDRWQPELEWALPLVQVRDHYRL